MEKLANQAAIQSGKPVEVFYHDDQFVIMDLGGIQATNVLGILGPVGLLVGITAQMAHKLDSGARTARRSEEFSKLIDRSFPGQSINQAFATQVGDWLVKNGRGVKVTKVMRPSGSDDLAASVSEDMVPTEGHMQLLLRLSTGYGATSATDTYKPMTIIEYALKDEDGKVLMSRSFDRIYGESEKTFLTYASLLEDHKGARDELGARLNFWSEPLYTEIFHFPDQVAEK
ncbi:hypothetical protein [Achromobacter insolitus]|uniref:hypothetical protein n=1 Tax=Achromobacter insolitus TaxID=217204 RepID=UPI001FB715AB|nr:hypothetical protein [Achromobacter insolitus]